MITRRRRRRKAGHAPQEREDEEKYKEVQSTTTTMRRTRRRRKRDELLSADADLLRLDHRALESLNCTIKTSKIVQITKQSTRKRDGTHRIHIKSRLTFTGLVLLLLTIIGRNGRRQDTPAIVSAFYTQPTRTLTPSSITTNTRRKRIPNQSPIDFILHANFFDDDNNNRQQLYTPSPLSPLKVMLFVDGTWLYYSIYEREYVRDIVAQKYGKDWKNHYTIEWSAIPMVACRALLQDKKSSWSAILTPTEPEPNGSSSSSWVTNHQPQTQRPVEISRVMVYSSMKRTTPTTTFRYRMFSDMADAGFDVNMMEQINGGGREKCVDIQLAVDMLYYATVPDAYDVALLLTGDKDFLPAVVRCRQKGRRVGLISMRSAASQSFTDTPNLLDYNTIWIEDYIDEWVREMTPEQKAETQPSNYENRKGILHSSPPHQSQQIGQRSQGVTYHRDHIAGISHYVIERVVADFVAESGEPKVSIRDIGREIKSLRVNGVGILADVKKTYGGLYQFLVLSEIFDVTGSAGQFFVELQGDQRLVESKLEEEKKKATLTADESKFLSEYAKTPKKPRDIAYEFTLGKRDLTEGSTFKPPLSNIATAEVDYDNHTVAMLKEKCRAAGLPVSGRKAELIERLQSHSKESRSASDDPAKYLERIVVEYLQATGGRASSRDIGRYLGANAASESARSQPQNQTGNNRLSAHNEMKLLYGTLKTFISCIDYLEITYDLTGGRRKEGPIEGEFDVILTKEKKNSSKEMLSSSA